MAEKDLVSGRLGSGDISGAANKDEVKDAGWRKSLWSGFLATAAADA